MRNTWQPKILVDELISGPDAYSNVRCLVFNMACWDAALRVYKAAGLRPKQRDYCVSYEDEDIYWQKCSLIVQGMKALADLCRQNGIVNIDSPYWLVVDELWKHHFTVRYEFRRTLERNDLAFVEFVECVGNQNKIKANGYCLWPGKSHEETDDYGQPIRCREWWLRSPSGETHSIARIDPDEYKRLYELLFAPSQISMEALEAHTDRSRSRAERYQEPWL